MISAQLLEDFLMLKMMVMGKGVPSWSPATPCLALEHEAARSPSPGTPGFRPVGLSLLFLLPEIPFPPFFTQLTVT